MYNVDQRALTEYIVQSIKMEGSCFRARVVPSTCGDGRENGAEAGRIFSFSCAYQQCDERAISNPTDIKTHRA